MKKRMFGIRKGPVDKLVAKVKWDFLSKKNELEYELQTIKNENKKLQNRLQELNEKSSSYQEELWNFGKERIQKVIYHLSKQKEIEMVELRKMYAERMHRNNQQLQDLMQEIEENEQFLQKMLDQLTSMVEQANFHSKSNQRDDSNNPSFSQMEENLPSSILEQGQSMLINEQESSVTTIVEQNELDVQKKEQEDEYKNSQEIVHEYAQEHVQEDIKEVAQEHVQNTLHPSLTDRNEEEPSPSQNQELLQTENIDAVDSFWGDIESNVVDTQNDALLLSDDLFISIDKEFNVLSSQNEQFEKNETKGSIDTKQPNESVVKEEGFKDLIEQIDSIKSQYIVGKVAGTDLFDLQGNLIIAKSSLITREIVERANRAGKLADLIVNMKLADSEEEKDAKV